MWAIRPTFILMACAALADARRIVQQEQALTEAETEVLSAAVEQEVSGSNTSGEIESNTSAEIVSAAVEQDVSWSNTSAEIMSAAMEQEVFWSNAMSAAVEQEVFWSNASDEIVSNTSGEIVSNTSGKIVEQAASESNTSGVTSWRYKDHRFCIDKDTDLVCSDGTLIIIKSAYYNRAKKDIWTKELCAPAAPSPAKQDANSCKPRNTESVSTECDGHRTCKLRVQDHKSCVTRPWTFMRVVYRCVAGKDKPKDEFKTGKQVVTTTTAIVAASTTTSTAAGAPTTTSSPAGAPGAPMTTSTTTKAPTTSSTTTTTSSTSTTKAQQYVQISMGSSCRAQGYFDIWTPSECLKAAKATGVRLRTNYDTEQSVAVNNKAGWHWMPVGCSTHNTDIRLWINAKGRNSGPHIPLCSLKAPPTTTTTTVVQKYVQISMGSTCRQQGYFDIWTRSNCLEAAQATGVHLRANYDTEQSVAVNNKAGWNWMPPGCSTHNTDVRLWINVKGRNSGPHIPLCFLKAPTTTTTTMVAQKYVQISMGSTCQQQGYFDIWTRPDCLEAAKATGVPLKNNYDTEQSVAVNEQAGWHWMPPGCSTHNTDIRLWINAKGRNSGPHIPLCYLKAPTVELMPEVECEGLTVEDFAGEFLTVTQESTMHGSATYTYEITIGEGIVQKTSDAGNFNLGSHHSYNGMTETFSNGDSCGRIKRSATIIYTIGPELKLVKAHEPSMCVYEYEIKIPARLCKSKTHKVCHPAVSTTKGRCGPGYGRCNRKQISWAVYCNTANGWCGITDAHRDAQPHDTYDWEPQACAEAVDEPAVHALPAVPAGPDQSKCTDRGSDCCASESWGERQTCASGYIARKDPDPARKCSSLNSECKSFDRGIGCYACYPQ